MFTSISSWGLQSRSIRLLSSLATAVRISLVTFEPDEKHAITSGNGVGTLSLEASVETIEMTSSTIEVVVNTALPVPLNASLWRKCNETLHGVNETYANVASCTTTSRDGRDRVTLSFAEGDAPEVTLRLVRVAVSTR